MKHFACFVNPFFFTTPRSLLLLDCLAAGRRTIAKRQPAWQGIFLSAYTIWFSKPDLAMAVGPTTDDVRLAPAPDAGGIATGYTSSAIGERLRNFQCVLAFGA
jgi:hypothetical protein